MIQNDWMVTLETPRLILRRWREEDVAPMAAVNADPEVMRWIRGGSVRDEQQTRDGVQAWESEWESQGFGLFAVEIRSTGGRAWPPRLGMRLVRETVNPTGGRRVRCSSCRRTSTSQPLVDGGNEDGSLVADRELVVPGGHGS